MFGDILKMLPKDKLIRMVKPYVPMILQSAREAIATEAGASPGQRTGCFFFSGQRGDGTATTMAAVHECDELGTPGLLIGVVDVNAAIDGLDLAEMLGLNDGTTQKLLG